jgi:hypothetical protein
VIDRRRIQKYMGGRKKTERWNGWVEKRKIDEYIEKERG